MVTPFLIHPILLFENVKSVLKLANLIVLDTLN